jgi:hypothetical protein
VWVLAWMGGTGAVLLARRHGEAAQARVRRRIAPLVAGEHVALVLGLGSGWLLMQALGLDVGQRRWLDVKLGLVAFLVLPLEAMHAWVSHGWIARGLRATPAPPLGRVLERGIAMDDIVRTLTAVLLGAGVPLLVWLSVKKPF